MASFGSPPAANRPPTAAPPYGRPLPYAAPAQEPGMLKAGRILLLIGWILQFLGVLWLFAMIAMMTFLNDAFGDEATPFGFMGVFYGLMALVGIAGGVVGVIAWTKSRTGDLRMAGILGIVAGCLPPVQVVTLIGGILLLVAQNEQRNPPPQVWGARH